MVFTTYILVPISVQISQFAVTRLLANAHLKKKIQGFWHESQSKLSIIIFFLEVQSYLTLLIYPVKGFIIYIIKYLILCIV